MAYLLQSEKEKDEKQQQEGTATGEKVIATQSASGPSAPTSQPAQQQQAGPSSSGTYTNLMNYVNANQGKDTQMGQQVRNTVDQSANEATQKLDKYQQTGQEQIQQNTIQTNETLNQTIKTDPTKVDKDEFNKYYHATYQGPKQATDIEGYSDTYQDFARVGSQVQAAGGGLADRRGLLEDTYARPSYTSGEKNLDSFILGTGQGGQQQLRGIQDTYGNFGGQFTDATQQLQQSIADAQATTDAAREATQTAHKEAVEGYTGTFNDLLNQLPELNKQGDATYNRLRSALGSENITERNNAFSELGIDPKVGNYLLSRGVTADAFLSDAGDLSLGDLVDDSSITNYQALLDLVGGQSAYDFSRTGNSSAGYNLDQDYIGNAQRALDLETQVNRALADAQTKRDEQYASLVSALGGGFGFNSKPDDAAAAAMLGIDEGNLRALRAAGLNPLDYISQSADLVARDVMSPEQLSQYNELAKLLGISPELLRATSKSPGNKAWNFDWDRAQQDLAAWEKNLPSTTIKPGTLALPVGGSVPAYTPTPITGPIILPNPQQPGAGTLTLPVGG